MRLTLKRRPSSLRSTIGELYIDGERFCYTLEDPVHAPGVKIPGSTAIPAGVYPVVITHSPRFGRRMPLLLGVPGFEGIRIHVGNVPEDTAGCILVGGIVGRAPDTLMHSVAAYDALYRRIDDALARGQSVVMEVLAAPATAEPAAEAVA